VLFLFQYFFSFFVLFFTLAFLFIYCLIVYFTAVTTRYAMVNKDYQTKDVDRLEHAVAGIWSAKNYWSTELLTSGQ